MPVFFILSGWSFNVGRHPRFAKFALLRFKSLIVPYFFWGILLYGFLNTVYCLRGSSKSVPLSEFLYSLFYLNAEISPFSVVQWFLTCMFFTQLIAWLLIRLCRENGAAVAVAAMIIAAIGWSMPHVLPFRLPLSLDVAPTAAAFFLLGWFIPNKLIPVLRKGASDAARSVWLFIVYTGVGTVAALANGYVNMRIMQYGNPVLYYVSAALLSFSVMRLSAYIQQLCSGRSSAVYRFVLYSGSNTLLILMLNQFFIRVLKSICNRSGLTSQLSGTAKYLVFALMGLIVVIVITAVSVPVNRIIPFSVGRSNRLRPRTGRNEN